MRKILNVVFFVLFSQLSFSQMFFDAAIKGYFGTTWLVNSKIFQNPDYEHQVSLGGSGGGKLGFNFNENVEIVVEALYGASNQKFIIKEAENNWNKRIKFTALDVPMLLRYNKNNGSYVEGGAQYSNILTAMETYPSLDLQEASHSFHTDYWSAIIGFGGYMMGWENLGICFGFRIAYSFADIVSGGVADAGTYKNTVAKQDPYQITTPFSAGFVLEINYDLGYMVKSPCDGRRSFLFFQ